MQRIGILSCQFFFLCIMVQEEKEVVTVLPAQGDLHAGAGFEYGFYVLLFKDHFKEVRIEIPAGTGCHIVGTSLTQFISGQYVGSFVKILLIAGKGFCVFHMHDVADYAGFIFFAVP